MDTVDFSQQLYVQVERKKADGTYVVVGLRGRLTIVPYAFSFQTPLTLSAQTNTQPLLRIINTIGPAISGESTGGGRGINGSSNTGRGVYGYSESDVGVYGVGNAGTAKGVYGIHNGTGYYGYLGGDSYAVFGHGFVGVHGENADATIYGKLGTGVAGVYGKGAGAAYSGYFEGGAGVRIVGDLNVTGTKNFSQPHPHDPTKEIVYIAMEAPETAVMIRGTARLINGKAVIETPYYFRFVASEEGITVQFTPRSAGSKGLAAIEVNRDRVVVAELMDGTGTYEFDYFITARRRGFEAHEPVQSNKHFTADMKTKEEFEKQYQGDDMATRAMRELLISNGILTKDGKLNMELARRLGWIIKDADVAQIK